MADDDIIEEEINLESVVDERTYKKAMEVISGVKKATKELKKSTKEAKEVTKSMNLTGSGSMDFGAFGDQSSGLPKGVQGEIPAGVLASGQAPASRSNTFRQMQEDLKKLKEQALANRTGVERNQTENDVQSLQLKTIGTQMKLFNAKANIAGGQAMKGLGWMRNPSSKAMGLVQGTLGKFLPIAIAMTLVTTVFSMVMSMFGDGGIFDTRKFVKDEVGLYMNKELLADINRGNIFIGNQYVQGQGIGTSGSSTRDKSYAHLTDRPMFQGK